MLSAIVVLSLGLPSRGVLRTPGSRPHIEGGCHVGLAFCVAGEWELFCVASRFGHDHSLGVANTAMQEWGNRILAGPALYRSARVLDPECLTDFAVYSRGLSGLKPVRLSTFQPRTKTQPNRTKMSVFSVLGFGSCFPILRLSASALVLEAAATKKPWNQTNPRASGERHGTLRPPHTHDALGPICTAH